jgi:hypothetical protein
MPYRKRISTLEESCRLVEDQLSKLEKEGNKDPKKLANLREASVKYNIELKHMIRAQWDHDHETVDLDDDR